MQDYPSRPLTIIIPQTSNSVVDVMARMMAPKLSAAVGQPVLLENKPGLQGLTGCEYFATQPPADGYTLLVTPQINLSAMSATTKNMGFTPATDIVPIVAIASTPILLVSSVRHPWKTFDALAAHVRANPGKLTYGAASNAAHFFMEAVLRDRGMDVSYRPSESHEAYIQAIVSGDLHISMMTKNAALEAKDQLHLFAQTPEIRTAVFPDVPTFRELSLLQLDTIFMFYVRSGTPQSVISTLSASLTKGLKNADLVAQFDTLGLEMIARPVSDGAESLAAEISAFRAIVERVGTQAFS